MNYHILTCIICESLSHKLHTVLKSIDCVAGLSFLGFGTVKGPVASLLGIKVERKEVVQLLLSPDKSHSALSLIASQLHLDKKGQGIAYLSATAGCINVTEIDKEDWMYQKITVITERGKAEEFMDIAREAGAMGGTIVHGRGTGGAIATRLFGFEIEPEKDLLFILAPSSIACKIVAVFNDTFHFDKPGSGILFVEPVLEVIGL